MATDDLTMGTTSPGRSWGLNRYAALQHIERINIDLQGNLPGQFFSGPFHLRQEAAQHYPLSRLKQDLIPTFTTQSS